VIRKRKRHRTRGQNRAGRIEALVAAASKALEHQKPPGQPAVSGPRSTRVEAKKRRRAKINRGRRAAA